MRALAAKVGVTPTTIQRLERGQISIQLDIFLKVLSALDIAPDEVLGANNTPAPVTLDQLIGAATKRGDGPTILRLLAAEWEKSTSLQGKKR
jgi:transcriptional regulator with XRE-family HTH domain